MKGKRKLNFKKNCILKFKRYVKLTSYLIFYFVDNFMKLNWNMSTPLCIFSIQLYKLFILRTFFNRNLFIMSANILFVLFDILLNKTIFKKNDLSY